MQLASNCDKTFLGIIKENLLRYVISVKDRKPDPKNIIVIGRLATPTNAKGIAKLLRHVGWYRKLIPDFDPR